jgi:hypothetical protein
MLNVTADYTRSPLGTWHLVVTVGGHQFQEVDGADIHETFMKALDLFDQASRAHGGQVCATIHARWRPGDQATRRPGDQAAFAALAEAHQSAGSAVPSGRL